MKNNRNTWNDVEVQTLITTVEKSKNIDTGCKKAAGVLGRTALACSLKYYQYKRKTKTNSIAKLANSEPVLESNMVMSFKIKNAKISNGYLTIEI